MPEPEAAATLPAQGLDPDRMLWHWFWATWLGEARTFRLLHPHTLTHNGANTREALKQIQKCPTRACAKQSRHQNDPYRMLKQT